MRGDALHLKNKMFQKSGDISACRGAHLYAEVVPKDAKYFHEHLSLYLFLLTAQLQRRIHHHHPPLSNSHIFHISSL